MADRHPGGRTCDQSKLSMFMLMAAVMLADSKDLPRPSCEQSRLSMLGLFVLVRVGKVLGW